MNNEELILKSEKELECIFKEIDKNTLINSKKVLDAFHEYSFSESDLNQTVGYGYNDQGRDKLDQIFAYIFDAESAIVRNQFISGSHAITIALQGVLRPNDTLLAISGTPYDTLHEVIGIKPNNSSLMSFNVNYKQIDLIDNDFDYEKIKEAVKENIKLIHIQRSRGYSLRDSLTIDKIEKVIKVIREINKDVKIFIDNCYCEFVETTSPICVGANLIAGSLIKNLGAGIATNGAYIAGDEDLVNLCAERLTVPGEGREVGPSQGANRNIALGLYMAPKVVSEALKTAILTSKVLEEKGLKTTPKYNDKRADIVQLIYFNNKEQLIDYAVSIQHSGAVDSHVSPTPSPMPGYDNDIIMSSPSFTQGSSIELSCDGPIRDPLVLFQQGSLTYEYGKIAILNALNKLDE